MTQAWMAYLTLSQMPVMSNDTQTRRPLRYQLRLAELAHSGDDSRCPV